MELIACAILFGSAIIGMAILALGLCKAKSDSDKAAR